MSGESQIVACRMYEKKSATSGNRYFVGLMGGVRVLLFFDQRQTDQNTGGDPIWNMVFQPADNKRSAESKREAPKTERAPRRAKRDDSRAAPSTQYQAPLDDDLPPQLR